MDGRPKEISFLKRKRIRVDRASLCTDCSPLPSGKIGKGFLRGGKEGGSVHRLGRDLSQSMIITVGFQLHCKLLWKEA